MEVAGRVCQHCTLDDKFTAWELRMFLMNTRAGGGAGGASEAVVTSEEAISQARLAALQRIGVLKLFAGQADWKLIGSRVCESIVLQECLRRGLTCSCPPVATRSYLLLFYRFKV